MDVCVYVCVCVCAYMCVYVCVHISLYMRMCVCVLQEVDAGLLTVIGYPAFAVRDPSVIQETRDFIKQKLNVSVCPCP